MKQYMLAVHGVDGAEAPPADDVQEMYADVDKVNQELQAAGVWVFAGGLLPVETATVVRVDAGKVTTTDGPFADTKEHLGGFWVIRARDLDEALGWAEKCSAACRGPVEVRPFEDMPDA